jgi:hypothetical protein
MSSTAIYLSFTFVSGMTLYLGLTNTQRAEAIQVCDQTSFFRGREAHHGIGGDGFS